MILLADSEWPGAAHVMESPSILASTELAAKIETELKNVEKSTNK